MIKQYIYGENFFIHEFKNDFGYRKSKVFLEAPDNEMDYLVNIISVFDCNLNVEPLHKRKIFFIRGIKNKNFIVCFGSHSNDVTQDYNYYSVHYIVPSQNNNETCTIKNLNYELYFFTSPVYDNRSISSVIENHNSNDVGFDNYAKKYFHKNDKIIGDLLIVNNISMNSFIYEKTVRDKNIQENKDGFELASYDFNNNFDDYKFYKRKMLLDKNYLTNNFSFYEFDFTTLSFYGDDLTKFRLIFN